MEDRTDKHCRFVEGGSIMNKKLFTQIWNERWANVPLFIELLLVSVALWYVVDAMYVRLNLYFQPKGFDSSHTYLVTADLLSEENPAFDPDRVRTEGEDMFILRERISLRPDVEAVSISYAAHPYQGERNFSQIVCDTTQVWVENPFFTPEFIRVFRYRGVRGETPEELAGLFESDGIMLSGEPLRKEGIRGKEIRDIRFIYDEHARRNLACLQTVHRDDYEDEHEIGLIFSRIYRPWASVRHAICLRVKAEQDDGFIDRFWKEASANYRVGNVYIRDIKSMQDVRRNYHKYDEAQNKIFYGVMVFLLLNVFIALFGVFWFRTRQRRREIAIQRAMGSTRGQVFGRLMSEGVLLLLLATLPALAVDFCLVKAEFVPIYGGLYFNGLRFAVTTGLTFLLIVFTLAGSIAYPAFKATRIPPAGALNESE